jgi:hypothetical protein
MVAAVPMDPQRKSKVLTIAIIAGGILAFVGVIAAILLSSSPPETTTGKAETIQIEVRSTPHAAIRVDGRDAGHAPVMLAIPKRTGSVRIEADTRRGTIERVITPDHDQVVDLTR